VTIYLDHAATTPVDPRVRGVIAESLQRADANPSSVHRAGRESRARVEVAREAVAQLIGARPEEILFTSGATEADNLALLGVLRAGSGRSGHLVTSRIEHRAVLDTAGFWASNGHPVSYVNSDRQGKIPVDAIVNAIRPDTALASVILVNNETGVRQAVESMVAAKPETLWHSDAAQALGKIPLDVRSLGVDLLSLSAHKMGGPAGIGALWVGPRAHRSIQPILHGGGQERGLRPGTLAVHQILGWGEACRIARLEFDEITKRMRALTERLAGLLLALPGVSCNGSMLERAPHILNLAFAGVDGEALHASLGEIAVSGGSACGAEKGEPSYVLRALGLDDAAAEASVRFSVGPLTTENDIEVAVKIVKHAYIRLRDMAPS
jgi:cysteine desulfurase